jgi:hypothetical protein
MPHQLHLYFYMEILHHGQISSFTYLFFTSRTSCLRVAFRRIFFSSCPFLCSRVDLGFVCLGLVLAATAGICFAVRVFPPAGARSAASHVGSARLHSSACVCKSFSLQLTRAWSSILSRRLRCKVMVLFSFAATEQISSAAKVLICSSSL